MICNAFFKFYGFAPQLVIAQRLIFRKKTVCFFYFRRYFLYIFLALVAPEHFRNNTQHKYVLLLNFLFYIPALSKMVLTLFLEPD